MSSIPAFRPDGLLPPGDYPVTFAQLRSSVLATGPGATGSVNWDSAWRLRLINNLEILVGQLWSIGITGIFVDGSFVEDKDHPNDIDGYFECEDSLARSGALERMLNLLDPHKIWTWSPHSRRPYHGFQKQQLPMWHQYRVELYPHFPGLMSGIVDKHGNQLEFPAAFRQCRSNGDLKGIIKIIPEVQYDPK